ncbi:MAG: hypothetical protein QG614_16 [Patescibacteria group bacterium]|nr:hypothetical protein [Patescibacteria group bacterium]
MHNNIVNFRISNGSIVRVLLWCGLAYSLFYFSDLLLTLLVGLVIASTMDPIAKSLSEYKIPRVVTISSLFILFFASLAVIVYFVVPTLVNDIVKVLNRLPQIVNDIDIFGKTIGFQNLSNGLISASSNVSQVQLLSILKESVLGAGSVAKTTGAILGNVANIIITIVLAFYLAVQENGINKFLKLITPKSYEKYILDLWARSEAKIGSWAKGQILVGLIVGTIVYVTLTILGVPYAALFGFLSFIGELVPMVGLLLSGIPAIITSYFIFGLSFAIIVGIIFFIISQFESYILYPKIMDKVVGVPGIITLIAFIIGAKMAGFLGIVLAVPFAAIAMEIVNDILNERLPQHGNEIEKKLN